MNIQSQHQQKLRNFIVQIRGVDKNTLLLWGANDQVLDPTMLSKYEDDIKLTETRVFQDCGHWVHLEQADGLVEEIRSFSERQCSMSLIASGL